MDNNISIKMTFDNKVFDISSDTNIYLLIKQLEKEGININVNRGNQYDPDNTIISRKIYRVIFPFYNENNCRGDTINTYNSTFGENNHRLKDAVDNGNITNEQKNKLLIKAENFRHTYQSIGNFTILERWHYPNENHCINSLRGIGSLKDSWPLTLLCIQDYINNYTNLSINPLKKSFDTNESTISYFKNYKEIKNGFEKFCDDQYLSPKYYGNETQFAYVDELQNGNYKVKLDLFDGLSFSKPFAKTVVEMEQYIDRSTNKIIKRGIILLNEYLKNSIKQRNST